MEESINQFIEYARECVPNEACALIYNNQLHLSENKASLPTEHFVIPLSDMVKAYESPTGIQLVLHSHPKSSPEPSPTDIEGMKTSRAAWLIFSIKHQTLWIGENGQGQISRVPKYALC